MYSTYILYSPALDEFYTGHCDNTGECLASHNNGNFPATRKTNDWVFVYLKEFDSRKQANMWEMTIKRKKSRNFIEKLISQP